MGKRSVVLTAVVAVVTELVAGAYYYQLRWLTPGRVKAATCNTSVTGAGVAISCHSVEVIVITLPGRIAEIPPRKGGIIVSIPGFVGAVLDRGGAVGVSKASAV